MPFGSGKKPGRAGFFMPHEAKNKRNQAAQHDGDREYVSQKWNADHKNQHASNGKDRSNDLTPNAQLRGVDLWTRRIIFHESPPVRSYHKTSVRARVKDRSTVESKY